MNQATAPYLSPLLRRVTGPALRPGGLALTRRALDLCRFSAGVRLLDLGCGPGESLGHMAGEPGLAAIGLDISPTMLAEAKAHHPGVPLLAGGAGALPLADESLAGVLAECVLSLLERPERALAECRRVLAPAGRLIISDLYLRRPLARETGPGLPGCLGGARGREAWEALVLQAGFEMIFWEDHSAALRELSARLVWEHGSAAAFWRAWCGQRDYKAAMERASLARPGYFLLIARKEGERSRG